MPASNFTMARQRHGSPLVEELTRLYEALDDSRLMKRLWQYRWTGRRGFDPRGLWRAVLAAQPLRDCISVTGLVCFRHDPGGGRIREAPADSGKDRAGSQS